jgi:hypothetical protein
MVGVWLVGLVVALIFFFTFWGIVDPSPGIRTGGSRIAPLVASRWAGVCVLRFADFSWRCASPIWWDFLNLAVRIGFRGVSAPGAGSRKSRIGRATPLRGDDV